MNWLVLTYTLPARESSSQRVNIWRRLRRLGVVSLPGGIHVLPDRDECREAFHVLVDEISAAHGKANFFRTEEFFNLSNSNLVQLFHEDRRQEYAGLGDLLSAFEKQLDSDQEIELAARQEQLNRLVRRMREIQSSDYFEAPAGAEIGDRLMRLQQRLSPRQPLRPWLVRTTLDQYRDKRWVTNAKPAVDGMACAWFIRRLINPKAEIRYADQAEAGEVAFDMTAGEFGHRGDLCTFEILLISFGLDDPALQDIAHIVHAIDLNDGRYSRPEAAGVEKVFHGWDRIGLTEQDLEARGIALFEGLYQALASRYRESTT